MKFGPKKMVHNPDKKVFTLNPCAIGGTAKRWISDPFARLASPWPISLIADKLS